MNGKSKLTRDFCETHMSLSFEDLFEENEQKRAKRLNFLKFKGHNFVKNCSNIPKIEPDLDTCIIIIKLYTKFHISTRNFCEENE